ncbi:MAG: LysM peptidoglycan-binding domain-containing protein [Spirosomataceae bacterium]
MEERNQRPKEGSNLPAILLAVLVFIILALLYVGWEYLTDKPSSGEMTNVKIDSTALDDQDDDSSAQDLPPVQVITPVPTATPPTNTATTSVAEEQKPAKEEPKPEPKKEEPKPEEKPVTTAPNVGGVEYVHTIATGQTFYGIANRYNLKFATLQALNPQIKDVSKDVKIGVTKLKVRIKAIHTVGPGDVLRVVAQKYGISKEMLMKANGKTKDFAERGEKLVIPFAEKQ